MSTELKAELLGLSNIINDPTEISGPRVTMNGNQVKQTPAIENPDPLQFPTGNELEYAKYLINDRSHIEGTVIARHSRVGLGKTSALEHTIFVRETGENSKGLIHIHEIKPRRKHHEVFASELKLTEEGHRAIYSSGGRVSKGMSYNQPSSYVNGEWAISCSLPTAIMSDHTLIEDSYTISQSASDQMLCWAYKDYVFNMKAGQTLLNLWGTLENPRFLPRIGEAIRRGGKVMGLMDLSEEDMAIELSDAFMLNPIAFYCNIHHNDGDSDNLDRATVVDIEVIRNDMKSLDGPVTTFNIPDIVQNELDKHAAKNREYYDSILKTHISLVLEYGGEDRVPYSHKAKRIIYEAIGKSPDTLMRPENKRYRASFQPSNFARVYAYDRIDTYRVKVTVRYPMPLVVSGKISDYSGTKGIVSNILPDDKMPIDEYGNRVHVMRCCGAQLRRSTYLPIYIIYMSHVARERMKEISKVYDADGIDAAWPLILDLTETFNPEWAEVVDITHNSTELREELYKEIITKRFRALIPNDYEKSFFEICELLQTKYKITKSKLLLTNPDGTQEWTSREFYVGNIPTIRLDKHGREFSSIASPRFDPFGTIAKTTAQETTFRPASTKANTFISESEDRLFKQHGDAGLVDEVKDRSNSPIVSDHETINVLRHPTPQNMECAVDREKFPLGRSRPLQILQHVHHIAGLKLQKVKKNG